MSTFWLVQRLRANRNPTSTGFDRFFGLEYMGSSEFEFGEVPASLRRIRAAGQVVIEKREILRPNGMARDVFFVGPREGIDRKIDDFQTWVADEYPHGKEQSYFPENFEGTSRWSQGETIAWWSLGDDLAWALTVEVAENLRMGFVPAEAPATTKKKGKAKR